MATPEGGGGPRGQDAPVACANRSTGGPLTRDHPTQAGRPPDMATVPAPGHHNSDKPICHTSATDGRGGSNNNTAPLIAGYNTPISPPTHGVGIGPLRLAPPVVTAEAQRTADPHTGLGQHSNQANDWPTFMHDVQYPHLEGETARGPQEILDDDGDALEDFYINDYAPERPSAQLTDYTKWPFPTLEMKSSTAHMYERALHAHTTCSDPPRVDHTTSLHLPAWHAAATGHPSDEIVAGSLLTSHSPMGGSMTTSPLTLLTDRRQSITSPQSSLPFIPSPRLARGRFTWR